MKHSTLLRASVTSQALGLNNGINPALATDLSGWSANAGGGPDTPTLTWVPDASLPAPSPIGAGYGAGHMTYTGPDIGGPYPASLAIPALSGWGPIGSTQTLSLYIYVPTGGIDVGIISDATFGTNTGEVRDQWTRVHLTRTLSQNDPAIALWPADPMFAGASFYFTGLLVQPGSTVGNFCLGGGGQAGAPVQVLVDGSDTPLTANGLAGYSPSPGDRLLVQRVGGQLEIVQFLSRGTVPYVGNADLSALQAQVNLNSDDITSHDVAIQTTSQALTDYQTSNDGVVATLQGGYDALSGVGAAGVQEDYFWVGNNPALSTVKSVQISTYVQAGLSSGDTSAFSTYFGLWDKVDIGDITFSGTPKPPMTTFYTVFTAHSCTIVAGKDYGA